MDGLERIDKLNMIEKYFVSDSESDLSHFSKIAMLIYSYLFNEIKRDVPELFATNPVMEPDKFMMGDDMAKLFSKLKSSYVDSKINQLTAVVEFYFFRETLPNIILKSNLFFIDYTLDESGSLPHHSKMFKIAKKYREMASNQDAYLRQSDA